MRNLTLALVFYLSALASLPAYANDVAKITPHDRIVFLGDTAIGQHGYTAWLADYFVLAHPELGLSFRTSSTEAIWRAADGTVNALPTYQADVLSVRPNVVVVNFGTDDAGRPDFGQRQYSYFTERFSRTVHELKSAGATVLIVTPADLSTAIKPAPNEWYDRVIEDERAVALKESATLVDLHMLTKEVRAAINAHAGERQTSALKQGSVVTASNQALMCFAVLRSLGIHDAPASAEIDVVSRHARTARCKVDGLNITPERITFSRSDDALPADARPAVNLIPGHELNRYAFKVTGLKKGTWKLTVEDIEVGSFSSNELADGIDLATFPGPWRTIADAVHQKSIAIETAFAQRCRYGSEPKIPAEAESQRKALVDRMDAGIEKLVDEQNEIVKAPRVWKWSLTLAP